MSPLGVEWGTKYVIVGPDGTRAVFNDSTDPDFVGMLSPESSGLDSAEIREDAQDSTEADGGIHGNFWAGRRPVVLQGTIIAISAADRNAKVAKLKRATFALRGDAKLSWKPAGATTEVYVMLRRQQPLRITKGYVKEFLAPMISASAYILSAASVEGTSTFTRTTTAALLASGASKVGTPEWTNPTNIQAEDKTYAKAALSISQVSGLLYASFSPALPVNSQLATVRVEIGHKASVASAIEENLAQLGYKNSELFTANLAVPGFVWGTSESAFYSREFFVGSYGITAEKANSGTFGFGMKTKNISASSAATAEVDYIRAKFTYNVEQFVEIENEGDAEADAEIEITGPVASSLVVENVTTGKKLVISGELGLGKVILISTKNRTILKEGSNAYNLLVFAESSWWKLAPGKNKIVLYSTNSSSGGEGVGGRVSGTTKLKVVAQHTYI